MAIHVRCITNACPNYDEDLATEYWDKWPSAIEAIGWDDPWALPGIK
jgi:hypothetical protein